jgi:hypothetical protein
MPPVIARNKESFLVCSFFYCRRFANCNFALGDKNIVRFFYKDKCKLSDEIINGLAGYVKNTEKR